jgi:hypothetical protein
VSGGENLVAVQERSDLKRERTGMYVTTHDARRVKLTLEDIESLERFADSQGKGGNPLIKALLRKFGLRSTMTVSRA